MQKKYDGSIHNIYFNEYARFMKRAKGVTTEPPFIGTNRTFNKNIRSNSFADIDEENNTQTTTDPDNSNSTTESETNKFEKYLLSNSANINKYKTEGCVVVYDELLTKQTYNKISFSELLNILSIDETSVENFIDKDKGTWVDKFEENNEEGCLIDFESRFEHGNLRMAIKISDFEYDLILKNDINSGKTYHWFYFRIKLFQEKLKKILKHEISQNDKNNNKFEQNNQSMLSDKLIKFNIINCQKTDMLFSRGLRVLKYNEEEDKWSRDTKNNNYYINGLAFDERKFYTLTFSINFPKELEMNKYLSKPKPSTIFFSYCYPYTYTDLQRYINYIMTPSSVLKGNIECYLRMEVIGTTLSGNKIQMLLITDFESSFEEIAVRQAVILTSRVHPGESNASFVIQGVIDFLIDKDNPLAIKLRKKYVFKIVPMLNPDGVINGNFRTGLMGKDLNRLWADPRENICPTIYYTKEMIKKTIQSREVYLFCDFHGHSNKNNFFLYGCTSGTKKIKNSVSSNNIKNKSGFGGGSNYSEYVLSKLFNSKNSYFDPFSCIYKISQSKLKTARAVVKNEFNIDFSYCLESSIGSITIGEYTNTFFTPKLYHKIGVDFCFALADLSNKEIYNETLTKLQIEEALKLVEMTNSINKNAGDEVGKNISNTVKRKKDNITNMINANSNSVNSTITINTLNSINIPKGKKKLEPMKYHLSTMELINVTPKFTEARSVKAKITPSIQSVKLESLTKNIMRSKTNPKKIK